MNTFKELLEKEITEDISVVRTLAMSINGKGIKQTSIDDNSVSFSYDGKYIKDLEKILLKKLKHDFDFKIVNDEDTGDNVVYKSKFGNSQLIIKEFKGKITFTAISN